MSDSDSLSKETTFTRVNTSDEACALVCMIVSNPQGVMRQDGDGWQRRVNDLIRALRNERNNLRKKVNDLTELLSDSRANAADIHTRWRTAANALFQFNYPPDPKMLREVADEIDCGQDCQFGHTEWDTNAHNCSKRDTEGCAGDNAIQLREFADAIEARAHLVKNESGIPSTPQFSSDEFDDVAQTLLSGNDAVVRACMSNNFNIILNALAIAKSTVRGEDRSHEGK